MFGIHTRTVHTIENTFADHVSERRAIDALRLPTSLFAFVLLFLQNNKNTNDKVIVTLFTRNRCVRLGMYLCSLMFICIIRSKEPHNQWKSWNVELQVCIFLANYYNLLNVTLPNKSKINKYLLLKYINHKTQSQK